MLSEQLFLSKLQGSFNKSLKKIEKLIILCVTGAQTRFFATANSSEM